MEESNEATAEEKDGASPLQQHARF